MFPLAYPKSGGMLAMTFFTDIPGEVPARRQPRVVHREHHLLVEIGPEGRRRHNNLLSVSLPLITATKLPLLTQDKGRK
jgi:hypothetical protein